MVKRIIQFYRALRQSHQAILRGGTPEEIFTQICEAAVNYGGMKMAWIGMIDPATQLLHAATAYGSGKEYLDGIEISADANVPSGRGPIGIVIRENRPYWCNDYMNDPLLALWRDRGAAAGWAASAAMPLHCNSGVVGVLGVYSAQINAFNPELQELLLGMAADISFYLESEARRKAAASQQKKFESRLEGIINAIPDPILVKDSESRILIVNDAACELMQIPRERVLGKTLAEELSPEEIDFFLACDRRVLASGVTETVEEPLSSPDGEKHTLLTKKSRHVEPDGTRLLIAVLHDITQRKQTEIKLAQMQELLERTGALAKIGGWQVDLPTMKLSWTLETFHIAGIEPPVEPPLEEGINLFAPEARPVIAAAVQAAIDSGKSYDLELPIITRQGELRWVQTQGFAEVKDGKSVRLFGTFQDITERRKIAAEHAALEVKLRQAKKLEALGTLAGGIAHDFNNIIATIMGYAKLAIEDTNLNKAAQESMMEIVKSTIRARTLVQQILAFSRQQPAVPKVCEVSPIVTEAVRNLRNRLPRGVQLDLQLPETSPRARVDALQIEQVLINLGINAIQALAGGNGKILVSVDTVTPDATLLSAYPHLKDPTATSLVRITVQDNGPGIDAATLERIFEPFFTTKPVNQGTGLGLSVAHGIIQAHHGILIAESSPGAGATFSIYLPASDEAVATAEIAEDPAPRHANGVKHILFLDDEESMVELVKRYLGRRGYRVSGFTRFDDALEALRDTDLAFDLFVTDFNMPGTSGIAVAEKVHTLKPQLRVALVSGYIDDALIAKAPAAGITALIPKADGMDAFCEAVARLLEQA